MSIIYTPRGKALEYSDLAANLYTGCSHGCRYCYCPAILRMKIDDWADDPKPRRDVLNQLDKDAAKLHGDQREILLSFMSDPYHSDGAAIVTREALLILERHNLRVQVLTKGGKRSIGDFDILARNDWKFGSTIIFLNEQLREEWEPGAAPIAERIETVREAHRRGIFTWVSVEPVIDAAEALAVMRELRDVVDLWKVGKLNHDKEREAAIDWKQFLYDTEDVLAGKNFIIKKDLEKFRGKSERQILYTIGHSNHSLERFLELLRMHEITTIVDVRSVPQSRFAPHFNQKNLSEVLSQIGCHYIFLGKELGGKRQEQECYINGQIDEEKVLALPIFQEGCERLLRKVAENRVALLCSEKDPDKCHRTYWISKALSHRLTIRHILGDGSLIIQ
jgi:pyruvate-formate lyase-activating enzyme